MAHRRALVGVSAVQLTAGLAGQVVALRRRRPYDILFMHGSPDHIARDSLWSGTSYSPPVYLIGSQAWAVVRLARRPDERARKMLRLLGTSMIPGYLLERFGRTLLTPAGFDPIETPIVVVGLAGSVAMALFGRP